MNGIDTILRRLDTDAKAEADAVLKKARQEAADITARVTNRVKPGSVMLFHNGAKNTPEALPQVIEKLQADGFTFVKASDLIYKDNYTIDHSGKQILN